jgi:hypothetical protein
MTYIYIYNLSFNAIQLNLQNSLKILFLQLTRTESPYQTKSSPPGQCPVAPDNVRSGTGLGLFKSLNRCLLLKLPSLSPKHRRPAALPLQNLFSSTDGLKGSWGASLGSSSSVGTLSFIPSVSSSSSMASRWKTHFSTWSLNVLHSRLIPSVYLVMLMYSSSPQKLVAFPWLKLKITWPNLNQLVLTRSLSILACIGSNFAIQFLSCPRIYLQNLVQVHGS